MKNVSGKRGSNPPPTAWKAVALPNELLPRAKKEWERKDSNLRRLSQQIYSLSHLTALELSHRFSFRALRQESR